MANADCMVKEKEELRNHRIHARMKTENRLKM